MSIEIPCQGGLLIFRKGWKIAAKRKILDLELRISRSLIDVAAVACKHSSLLITDKNDCRLPSSPVPCGREGGWGVAWLPKDLRGSECCSFGNQFSVLCQIMMCGSKILLV